MAGMNPDITAAKKVELAISQCEGLAILPSLAARFFTQLGKMELTPATLAELIMSDPAFMVLVLRLCQSRGIAVKEPNAWIQNALTGVSLREIRDAVLSAKIYGSVSDEPRTDFRRELTRHCLAVACCAEQLAKLTTPAIDASTAHLAGLMHDIGKFLLDEAMPKSFDTLLEQARGRKTDFVTVERENLGTDHAILGKRLAQQLRLPSDVILGIWLHHSQTGMVTQAMPQARIAGVVELADCIVRRTGIGDSGSYGTDGSEEVIAKSLGLTDEQISEVERALPDLVNAKSEAAGLSILRPGWAYSEALRSLAGQLARESSKLYEQSEILLQSASQFDFVRDMLPKINSNTTALKLAEDFAKCWQRFYHTGPVCVYLASQNGSKTVEAVVVNPDAAQQTEAEAIVIDVPEGVAIIPESAEPDSGFSVVDAGDSVDWLLEQLEVDFDPARTKLAPLSNDGKMAGVIIFELRHPISGDISQRFAPAARLGAVALDMLETISNQQWFAEKFAQLLQRSADSVQRTVSSIQRSAFSEQQVVDTEAMAEMAAGAAHELNNPLSVIKGRAQLLAGAETDANKKQTLELIEENAGEISAIIDDLMSYANPQTPKVKQTAVGQIINEAVDLAGIKTNIDGSDIKIDISPETPKANVDSAQVAIALSNIICNAVEADGTKSNPVTIKASANGAKGGVTIEVSDSGRGMDEETLAKATQPFFSNKPAGRKRGMGLAHAQRLIQINNGTLEISSRPAKGTTVKITLPSKS
ncbi:MAG: HDOD domain-containing protein [Sedimentisphaerales bacterium]|jgi:putative nucleotidyltransferase with HDIG domain